MNHLIRVKENTMYTLVSVLSLKRWAYEQVPALALAWLIAEMFYKFHSFTLECAAFLATWFVLDALIQRLVLPLIKSPSDRAR
jgi:hypothetical protein